MKPWMAQGFAHKSEHVQSLDDVILLLGSLTAYMASHSEYTFGDMLTCANKHGLRKPRTILHEAQAVLGDYRNGRFVPCSQYDEALINLVRAAQRKPLRRALLRTKPQEKI